MTNERSYVDDGAPLLVVEDDPSLRDAIAAQLVGHGYNCESVATAGEALSHLRQGEFPIILVDLNLPDASGLALVQQLRAESPQATVILMTAFGSTQVALEALQAGAFDYLAKPFQPEELIFVVEKAAERERLRKENDALRSVIDQKFHFGSIVTESDSMVSVLDTVKRLSPFHTTVLITGESGTGKELLARAIHQNSPRRGKPFVAINCGAIPPALMESELFGHKKGAFTDATRDKRGLFEEANGGTIFLDEIGELPLQLQVKLLRALQERQIRRVGDEALIDIDVRIVAATLRNLEQDVLDGRFREDLFYRLNVVMLELPPLRERPEDIPLLAQHFVRKHSKRLGLIEPEIPAEVMRALVASPWKGNVRELENCMERLLVLSDSGALDVANLPDALRRQAAKTAAKPGGVFPLGEENLSIKQQTRALEIELIKRALDQTSGNRTHAARVLEISHRALLYKLKEYELGGREEE